jgi:predicted nucleic acid-binding protein
LIVYLDASVIVRHVLFEPNTWLGWDRITEAATSQIAIVECRRGLYKAHAIGRIDDAALKIARRAVQATLDRLKIIRLTNAVTESASQPCSVILGALDAIHLGSAIEFRKRSGEELIHFVTHDRQLALAAEEMHFPVLGV